MKVINTGVLSIGSVNPRNGKTQYDWNIYDDPEAQVALVSRRSSFGEGFMAGGYLLYSAKGTFKKGDQIKTFHHDNGRKLTEYKHAVQVVDVANCVKEDVLKMVIDAGYDYTTLRPFQKRKSTGRPNKLSTSYSVKGTWY